MSDLSEVSGDEDPATTKHNKRARAKKETTQLNIVQREKLARKRYKLALQKFFVKRLSHYYWEVFQALKGCTTADLEKVINAFPKDFLYE
jgi:hypothetical protein